MKNQVQVTNPTYLRSIPRQPVNKKKVPNPLGNFSQAIQGYFCASEMKFEDFEKLERKKQIARLDPNQSVDLMRMN